MSDLQVFSAKFGTLANAHKIAEQKKLFDNKAMQNPFLLSAASFKMPPPGFKGNIFG